jgi:hypothetical protein
VSLVDERVLSGLAVGLNDRFRRRSFVSNCLEAEVKPLFLRVMALRQQSISEELY